MGTGHFAFHELFGSAIETLTVGVNPYYELARRVLKTFIWSWNTIFHSIKKPIKFGSTYVTLFDYIQIANTVVMYRVKVAADAKSPSVAKRTRIGPLRNHSVENPMRAGGR